MKINGTVAGKLMLLNVALLALVVSACSSDGARSCSSSAECFGGESCVVGTCVPNELNARDDAGGSDADEADSGGQEDEDSGARRDADPSIDASTDAAPDSDDAPDAAGPACRVSPFEAECSRRAFEPNDWTSQRRPIEAGDWWCEDPSRFGVVHSYSAQICQGDDVDVYRIFIDNRTPCISGDVLITVTVELQTECDAQLFDIYPFWNSYQNICDTDERVRCEWSEDGRRFTIDWILEAEQLFDAYFAVVSKAADIQIDYTIDVKATRR